ncbi:hypothetical protein ELI48_02250 [Rhizobium ruizarguesonis]|uniref:hypothetical protein n=1 Tax=Rhizobium ruizarguesonis TaxID=2081791 RepID=UPI00103102CB|nr:hypothetical protein [Rhizobium ruizarguesonis]TAU25105.1 hypothetical protein ELI48_02250 [Rhizobium ruizarguesonis]TAU66747.1 hypothetical protein ELI45_02070 [Rhizobium ruizarguesonis]TAW08501.1 hypothetical protein ELI26_02240 [Rhizobium ruizarguesonis]
MANANDNLTLSFSQNEVKTANSVFHAFVVEMVDAVQAPFLKITDPVVAIGCEAIKAGARADLADLLTSNNVAVIEVTAKGSVSIIDIMTAYIMFADVERVQYLFTIAVLLLRKAKVTSPLEHNLQRHIAEALSESVLAELKSTVDAYFGRPR